MSSNRVKGPNHIVETLAPLGCQDSTVIFFSRERLSRETGLNIRDYLWMPSCEF